MTAPTPAPFRIDAVQLARRAWAHRGDLLRLNGAVAVLALGVVLLLPAWFVSSVTLVPAPNDALTPDFSGTGAMMSAMPFGLGAEPTPQDQLKMVLTSRAVADSVIASRGLIARWHVKGLERTRDRLADHVNITTPKQGQVIVETEARTPAEARDLATAFATYAASEGLRLKRSLATQRREYLEARLAEIEQEITRASGAVQAFEQAHRMVALPEQTRETMDAAGQLAAQAALLQTELASARRYFTDQSPEVAVLRDRLNELNRQLRELSSHGGTLLLKGDELPALKQQYLRLTREQTSLMAVSELLRRVYEQARVEEANPVPTFSVLDAPELPERHARPKRGLTVVAATLLSFAASLALLQWRGSLELVTGWLPRRRKAAPAPVADADPERRAA